MLLTLDAGHFHPTETVADKLSAVMLYVPEVLLHVSRGVRWDSDHVVTYTDDLQAICQEVVRGGYLARTHIGLDYFDASINRVAAWVIGMRNTLKALLAALLEPAEMLRGLERARGLHRAAGPAGGIEKPALRGGVGLPLPAAGRAGGRGVYGCDQGVREGCAGETVNKKIANRFIQKAFRSIFYREQITARSVRPESGLCPSLPARSNRCSPENRSWWRKCR